MINIDNDFRQLIPELKVQNIKATILESNKNITVSNVNYGFDGDIFRAFMKSITFSVENEDILNKNIKFEYGLLIDNTFKYINLGSFKVNKLEDSAKKEKITYTAYDKMLNFMSNENFDLSKLNITLPCSMLNFAKALANYRGLELYTESFFNSDLSVGEDFFTNQEVTERDVWDKIAESTLSVIFIKDDKVYIRNLDSNVISDTLNSHDLKDLSISGSFGPCNSLILGRGDVGDDVSEFDSDSIEEIGLQEIRIDENEFLDSIRYEIKGSMLTQLKKLKFYTFEAKDSGFINLEPGDFIKFQDRYGNSYLGLILKLSTNITTGITQNTYCEMPEFINSGYSYKTKEEKKTLKVERIAKKNEGLIEDIIEENTETQQKLTQVIQDVDGIKQSVENIQDFTSEKYQISSLILDNTVEGLGYVIQLSITGTMNFLTPSDTLVPSDNLVPLGDYFTLIIDKQSRINKSEDAIEYKIALDEPLRYYNENLYDELLYEDGILYLIRRIGINSDSEMYELETEIKTVLAEFTINTFSSTTYIYVKEYGNLNFYGYYIPENDYSDQFITKIEASSLIEQTAESINLSVNKTLEDYSTTEEMNSAINLTAESIVSSVNQTIEDETTELHSIITQTATSINTEVSKKVGKTEIISTINQSAEAITIDADKISLEGKQINLTGDNVTISSNKLAIDKNGKITIHDTTSSTYANNEYFVIERDGKDLVTISATGMYIFSPYGSDGIGIDSGMIGIGDESNNYTHLSKYYINVGDQQYNTVIEASKIETPQLNQTSLEKVKKNINIYDERALDKILNSDIYSYNLKLERDTDKKHIGFVIGDKYKTPKEVINKDGNAIELYSAIGILWKSVQEIYSIIKENKE